MGPDIFLGTPFSNIQSMFLTSNIISRVNIPLLWDWGCYMG